MECLLSFIKEWGALLLSSLGICGGFCAYLRHDRKIKEQELRLNELQIKQFEKEEAKEKMAEMKANIIHSHGGIAKIRFVNAGKNDAKHVRVDILSSKEEMSGIRLPDSFGPYDVINSQSYREEIMSLCEGHNDTLRLKITWDDEYQNNRSVSLTVPF